MTVYGKSTSIDFNIVECLSLYFAQLVDLFVSPFYGSFKLLLATFIFSYTFLYVTWIIDYFFFFKSTLHTSGNKVHFYISMKLWRGLFSSQFVCLYVHLSVKMISTKQLNKYVMPFLFNGVWSEWSDQVWKGSRSLWSYFHFFFILFFFIFLHLICEISSYGSLLFDAWPIWIFEFELSLTRP